MTVTFAEKLARMPGYQAGVPTGQAPEAIAAGGIAQLASNESPFPPHPKVVEAIQSAAGAMNRYPDPGATLLRRRIAERFDTEPGRIAIGNGSCEILLAAAEAWIREEGKTRIYLETSGRALYEPTRAFYLATGYSVATVLEDFYAPGDGKYIFVKVLPA